MLRRAFEVWLKNFVPLTLLVLLIQSPRALFLGLAWAGGLQSETTWGIDTLLGMILGFLASGAVTQGVFDHLRGRPIHFMACVRTGLLSFFPLLLVGLLSSLAISVG